MFKLKLINKPKMIKLKCGFSFPNIVLANLQEKETTPTKEMQQIIADQQYDGLSKVVVNAIPDEYIIPSGEININSNGTYDVTDKASANVNIPEKVLGIKSITSNGTYKAVDDNLDGYSQVTVETSGVDINDYFLSVGTPYNGRAQSYLKKFPQIDTSNQTTFYQMFDTCRFMTEIPQIDTSKGTNFYQMFSYCYELKTIPKINLQKATRIDHIVDNDSKLENLGGFENVGQAFQTTQMANYPNYELKLSYCPLLTHESLMNVINNLYDIATKGVKTQKLTIGSKNLEKLTAEEIAIATTKGFSVS